MLTRGFCFTAGFARISWCSKKQSTVALSSCEAEYVATTMATQEFLWMIRRLIQEMVTTHYHFVRENVNTGCLIAENTY